MLPEKTTFKTGQLMGQKSFRDWNNASLVVYITIESRNMPV